MIALTTALVSLLTLAPQASAHGFLKNVLVNGVTYPAWQVFQDDFVTPEPTRYVRRILNNGPVPDFTTTNITCNAGGNIPAKGIIPVNAGDKVKLIWDQWGSSHSGPVMTYLAKCTPNCASFKGDTGAVWVKIDQMAYDTTKSPPWGSDYLAKQGATWTVTIPPQLAPGEYLLRHEILGLHVAGTRMGAQFYPSCTQLKVSGSGKTELPSGVALPGAYNPDDKDGVLVQLWQVNAGQVKYVAPGGAVWSGAVANVN
ncbi:glycoside hydrolase [Delitschia confertaspora ATCC 74209]|uniref:lytic cellulose monooxygenase (C4-dehydrogenating) n=1 Tax=Delitschia confertaspora ATCC 74209 TaxID=1513339 RepID=A0A9P4JWT3_9PLEO|nr:glycoside hydrolase [Delitschia confertaspora ATCC 74209]